MLADGRYDVMVVDVEEVDAMLRIELVVLDGPHQGDVVAVRASGSKGDPVDLLGLPGTVTVAGGTPLLCLEP